MVRVQVGQIIKRFEARGFKIVALRARHADKKLLEAHYADLAKKPFYASLVEFMSSGPVVAMVWEGLDAVATGRRMLGETDPRASLPGTIRGDYALDVGRNVCHGSDSVASAQKEIALWFTEQELLTWTPASTPWLYEKPSAPAAAAAAPKPGGASMKTLRPLAEADKYDPLYVESGWDEWWATTYYRADNTSTKPRYVCMLPPPNVTGSLHIGHAPSTHA